MNAAQLLVAWLASAILAFAPGPHKTPERLAQVVDVSRSLLAVAFDGREPPSYSGPSGRARTALVVAAVGSQESAFLERIQAGDCRCRARPGHQPVCECDGSVGASGVPSFQAACYLQIHANDRGGIALTPDGEWTYGDELAPRSESADQARVYANADLLGEDPTACFTVGAHMIRKSLRRGGRLCMYTGELGPCPKADWRQNLADGWFRAHPPPAPDADATRVASSP